MMEKINDLNELTISILFFSQQWLVPIGSKYYACVGFLTVVSHLPLASLPAILIWWLLS